MRNVKHARRGKASAGFTLVELLVVIVIIGILAALITVVAANAVARANETAIKVELDNLANSFMEYKNRYGAYPPNTTYAIGLGNVVFPLPDAGQEAQRVGDFKRHLRKAFPRHREIDEDIESLLGVGTNPLRPPLTPAEAVWFYLRGFSPDPEHPLTGPGVTTSTANLERLFDFDEARLVQTRPWPTSQGPVQLWAYVPDGITQPFVYFDTSRPYSGATPAVPAYAPMRTARALIVPYVEAGPTGGRRFVNPNSFQILAAGLDDSWDPLYPDPSSAPLVPDWPFIQGHSDNLANFSQRNMEDSQP